MNGSIRQRAPGSWEIAIFLGCDENGKIHRRYETVRGTKRQAQQRLCQLLTAVDHGSTPSTERIKLCDWLQRWMMERIVPHRKLSTVDRYERAIRRHIEPSLGPLELDKISPAQINAFEAGLTANGESATSVNLVHAVLSGAMRYAASLELIMPTPHLWFRRRLSPRKKRKPPLWNRCVECCGWPRNEPLSFPVHPSPGLYRDA